MPLIPTPFCTHHTQLTEVVSSLIHVNLLSLQSPLRLASSKFLSRWLFQLTLLLPACANPQVSDTAATCQGVRKSTCTYMHGFPIWQATAILYQCPLSPPKNLKKSDLANKELIGKKRLLYKMITLFRYVMVSYEEKSQVQINK